MLAPVNCDPRHVVSDATVVVVLGGDVVVVLVEGAVMVVRRGRGG